MKTKYIVFDNGLLDDMLIFSDMQKHEDIARGLTVVSAGFLSIYNNKISCYGESISLELKARPEDEKIAYRALALETE